MEYLELIISYLQNVFISFFFFTFFICGAISSTSYAEQFKVPSKRQDEKGKFVVIEKGGANRWEAIWDTNWYEEDGKKKFKITINGKGKIHPFEQDVEWTSEGVWSAEFFFEPIEAKSVTRDLKGNLLWEETKYFDRKYGIAKFVRKDFDKGDDIDKVIEIKPDTLILEGMVEALRSFPFKENRVVESSLLTNAPKFYDVEFKPRGREVVKTKAGDIECYKIEMIPNLGILGIFKVFFPKTYFWFAVDPPHRWVKYEGLENTIGSPHVVMEVESGLPSSDNN